jgi:hypothetical protein
MPAVDTLHHGRRRIRGFHERHPAALRGKNGAKDPAEYFYYDFRTVSIARRFGGDDARRWRPDAPVGTAFDEWGIGHWAGGAEDTYERGYPVMGYAGSIYEWSWWLRGMEQFMVDLLEEPGLARAFSCTAAATSSESLPTSWSWVSTFCTRSSRNAWTPRK